MAEVFLHKVKNPKLFGVAKLNSKKEIIGIKEKTKKKFSNLQSLVYIFLITKLLNYQKV